MRPARHFVDDPRWQGPYWPATSDRVHSNPLGPGPHRLNDLLTIAMLRIEDRRETAEHAETTQAR
jgi:hypothetical protein